MAMELIETIEVGAGGAASIEFTSIPQDGVDLLLMFSGRYSNYASSQIAIILNGDTTTSNYQYQLLRGSGTTASSQTSSSNTYGATMNENSQTANTFSNAQLYFANYTSSSAKSWSMDGVNETNATNGTKHMTALGWNGTSAITSIKFDVGQTIAENSTASLYKIS